MCLSVAQEVLVRYFLRLPDSWDSWRDAKDFPAGLIRFGLIRFFCFCAGLCVFCPEIQGLACQCPLLASVLASEYAEVSPIGVMFAGVKRQPFDRACIHAVGMVGCVVGVGVQRKLVGAVYHDAVDADSRGNVAAAWHMGMDMSAGPKQAGKGASAHQDITAADVEWHDQAHE